MTVISKWGNSQGIRISKKFLKEAGLNVGDVVDIRVENGKIIIQPIRRFKRTPKLKIEDIFNIKIPEKSDFEWDKKGRELW